MNHGQIFIFKALYVPKHFVFRMMRVEYGMREVGRLAYQFGWPIDFLAVDRYHIHFLVCNGRKNAQNDMNILWDGSFINGYSNKVVLEISEVDLVFYRFVFNQLFVRYFNLYCVEIMLVDLFNAEQP